MSAIGTRPLVIGCGALASELVELTRRAGLPAMDLTCLSATLHNRPERIPAAVQGKIRAARARGVERIFVAYADCGTGGLLDRMLEAEGVERIEGAHCYEIYAGRAAFARLHDAEPGTFYLTDFLARNAERLVWRGLGLDRHPELLPLYFGNYRRVIFLAQTDDAALTAQARALTRKLGLAFERRFTGLGELAPAIAKFAAVDAQSHSSANESRGASQTAAAMTPNQRGDPTGAQKAFRPAAANRDRPDGRGIVTPSQSAAADAAFAGPAANRDSRGAAAGDGMAAAEVGTNRDAARRRQFSRGAARRGEERHGDVASSRGTRIEPHTGAAAAAVAA